MIKNIINSIDILNETIGRAASWLVLAMVLLICYDVTMRYSFHQGSVALQELEWHLFALIFLLGSAYTLKHNNHVRVDILYQSQYLSNKHRAIDQYFRHPLILDTLLCLNPHNYLAICRKCLLLSGRFS